MGNFRRFVFLVIFTVFCGELSQAAQHTVKPSETFYSIARKYGISMNRLMQANQKTDPKLLRIGQRLVIPSKTTSKKVTQRKVSKKSLRVVIDPGHGGRDKGAYWYGVRESDLNLRVAKKLEASLKARGYPVTMTRRSDVFISLAKRAALANRYRNSIFVSIHFNASRLTWVHGAETFYAGGKKGHYLAASIQRELVKKLKVRNRGARVARFTVLTATQSPAVLVECGFISN